MTATVVLLLFHVAIPAVISASIIQNNLTTIWLQAVKILSFNHNCIVNSVRPSVLHIIGRHGHHAVKLVGVAIVIVRQCTSTCVLMIVGVFRSTW